jgi:hypothetical protein
METPAEGFDTSGVRRLSQERSREVEQRLEPCSASWLRRMPSPRDSIRSRSVLIGGATERPTPTRRPTPHRTAHQCARTSEAALDDLITRRSIASSKRTAVRNFMSYVDPLVGHCSRQSRQGRATFSSRWKVREGSVACEVGIAARLACGIRPNLLRFFLFLVGEQPKLSPLFMPARVTLGGVCAVPPHAAFGCPPTWPGYLLQHGRLCGCCRFHDWLLPQPVARPRSSGKVPSHHRTAAPAAALSLPRFPFAPFSCRLAAGHHRRISA